MVSGSRAFWEVVDLVGKIYSLGGNGWVSKKDLAEEVRATERTLRRYLSVLKVAEVVEITEDKLRLRPEVVSLLEGRYDIAGYIAEKIYRAGPLVEKRLEEFARRVAEKFREVYSQVYLRSSEVRVMMINTPPRMRGLEGSALLYPKKACRKLPATVELWGAACRSKKRWAQVGGFTYNLIGTVACARSEAPRGRLGAERSVVYPDISILTDEELPYHDLFSEYPHFRTTAVSLVSRYIREINLLNFLADELEERKSSDELYIIRWGSLIPHGAPPLTDPTLERYSIKLRAALERFIRACSEGNVVPVGIQALPRHEFLVRQIRDLLGLPIRMTDHQLLCLVGEPGDVTCLMNPIERSKRELLDFAGISWKRFYEFYLVTEEYSVLKCDFYCLGDAGRLQQTIADIIYATSWPVESAPTRKFHAMLSDKRPEVRALPSVVERARYDAKVHLTLVFNVIYDALVRAMIEVCTKTLPKEIG